eukprot:3918826-Prorocentrum_lima.AAC.1
MGSSEIRCENGWHHLHLSGNLPLRLSRRLTGSHPSCKGNGLRSRTILLPSCRAPRIATAS